jgi:SET domain-containing protein
MRFSKARKRNGQLAFYPSELIYCKKTRSSGRGVFARVAIADATVVEIVPVLVLPTADLYGQENTSLLGRYVFFWNETSVALALGYGSLYNHSYDPNLACADIAPQTKRFIAIRDIAKGEELTFNYGGSPDSLDAVGFEVK